MQPQRLAANSAGQVRYCMLSVLLSLKHITGLHGLTWLILAGALKMLQDVSSGLTWDAPPNGFEEPAPKPPACMSMTGFRHIHPQWGSNQGEFW